MHEKLIELLERNHGTIAEAWEQRLSDPARLATGKLVPAHTAPLRPLLTEVIRLLADPQAGVQEEPVGELLERLGPSGLWRINLRHAVEVLLTGEVVVRHYARSYLDAPEEDQLALVESINRVFHDLIRAYTQRYCDQCTRLREVTDHLS